MPTTSFDAIPLDGLRGVLIDLDNTLYNYDLAHEAGLSAAFDTCALGFASYAGFAETYREARNSVIARLHPQSVCRSRFLAFQKMAEDTHQPFAYLFAAKLEAAYWTTLIGTSKPDARAFAFLERCHEAKLPVCIVSDMTAQIQERKIRHLGIEKLIAFLVTSEEVGAEKPDPRMFQTALTKLGATAKDVIMIGDNLETDIKGAEHLGIQPYWVNLTEASS